jgi:hypothetical protein
MNKMAIFCELFQQQDLYSQVKITLLKIVFINHLMYSNQVFYKVLMDQVIDFEKYFLENF